MGDLDTSKETVIGCYKEALLENTDISRYPEETAVIDRILERFWQLGWLAPRPCDVRDLYWHWQTLRDKAELLKCRLRELGAEKKEDGE